MTIVYAIITGSGLFVVLGTGLVAWWLNRRARRREAGLLVPKPKRARRVKAAAAAPAAPDIEGPAANGPAIVEVAAVPAQVPGQRQPVAIDLDRQPVRRSPDPRWMNDASGEYVMMRAATARAQSVATQARSHSQEVSGLLDTAERVYEEARQAHADSLAATPEPVPASPADESDGGSAREVARAALDAYRRGDLSAEELRTVWYGTSGWDASHDEAERRTREFRAAEVHARQEYHIALARARAARQAEYVADVAYRALGAETAAAATELASASVPDRQKRKRGRNRPAAPRQLSSASSVAPVSPAVGPAPVAAPLSPATTRSGAAGATAV